MTWSFHTEHPPDGRLRHAAPPLNLKPHHPTGLTYSCPSAPRRTWRTLRRPGSLSHAAAFTAGADQGAVRTSQPPPSNWHGVAVDWTLVAPYVTSALALVGSGFAIFDARRARRETARVDLARAVESSLNEALATFSRKDGQSDADAVQGIAEALMARRAVADSALDNWGHLLAPGQRDELRGEKELLGESVARLAGERMGLTWTAGTDHLIPAEELPARWSEFTKRVEGAFSAERDRVSEVLRTYY